MKKLGLLIFVAALVGSITAVWAITGQSVVDTSFLNYFKQIRGSGNVITEKRAVADFRGVDASGAMQIEIVIGENFSVELEGDDNILPLIETEVRGGILHFERKGNRIRTRNKLVARISMPEIADLEVSGASKAVVTGVKSENLKINASGASKIEISGSARDLNVDLSGASKLNAEALQAERVKIEASGASKASIFAVEAVDADASGASKIIYSGNPKSVDKDASGASSVLPN